MPVAVWANAVDVPGVVCADARLTDRDTWSFGRSVTSEDRLYGQAGWDIGLNFRDSDDLANKLTNVSVAGGRTIRRGEVTRLAIHAHGARGTIFLHGQPNGDPNKPVLTAESARRFHGPLHRIGLMTPDHHPNPAVILFVGCLAGAGPSGSALLIALSRIWPNRKVVAFATIGYAPGGQMSRSAAGCTEPGMRDTTALFAGEADREAGRLWPDLQTWPWASERSPRAKVAFNGVIVRGQQW